MHKQTLLAYTDVCVHAATFLTLSFSAAVLQRSFTKADFVKVVRRMHICKHKHALEIGSLDEHAHGPWRAYATGSEGLKRGQWRPSSEEASRLRARDLAAQTGVNASSAAPPVEPCFAPAAASTLPTTLSSAAAAPSVKAALPPHSDAQASAAQPGAPTKRQRCMDGYAKAVQPGSATACSRLALSALAAPSANEQLQRSFLDYGSS